MPVIEGHNVVGLVSESTLLDALMSKKDKKIAEIMEETLLQSQRQPLLK